MSIRKMKKKELPQVNFNNIDAYEILNLFDSILNNQIYHEPLVEYIYAILKTNQELTRDDNLYIDFSKMCSCSFNKFLLVMLLEIYSKTGIENINQKILLLDNITVKQYETLNLNFEQKLIVTIALAIPICHIKPIKLYSESVYSLNSYKKFKGLFGASKMEALELKINNLSKVFSFDKSNSTLQTFYINYYKFVHPKLFIEDIYTDIVLFTDFITSFPPNKNIYGFVSHNLYQVCSEILGNSTLSKHTRQYSAELMFKLIPIHGYNIAPSFFNDLFTYIADIDYYKWMNVLTAIRHHKKILQNMIMLIDYPEKIFEQPDKIISKTLYTLLGNAIESYTQFESICKETTNDPARYELNILFESFIEIVLMTLNVYTSIYTNAIVKNTYAETEEKYSMLVFKLIDSCTNKTSIVSTHFNNQQLTNQLLMLTYNSLYEHIDIAAKYLSPHLTTIKNGFCKSGLSDIQSNKIIESLENIKTHEIIYPEEFLDPLLCIPIENPILLPECNDFHDKTTIISQIHENGVHPYNRKKLSIEDLEKFNSQQEILDKLNDFIKRKTEYEQSQKKKHIT